MKENVLDLLMYLFEHYMEDEPGLPPEPQRADLQLKLLEAGFEPDEIQRAFHWLEGAIDQATPAPRDQRASSVRIYTDQEQQRLDLECRGFLLQLEEIGILSGETRETVIDRVMALDEDDMDLDRLKWVILLVLFARPGQEAAFAWMEDLVFDNYAGLIH